MVSHLVRVAAGDYVRLDWLESEDGRAEPLGDVVCRWVRRYKPPVAQENPEKELKLTAESLFLSLTAESDDPVEENAALKQFLALMLERKRVLRNRGRKPGADVILYEHRSSKRVVEVPAGEMDAAFFVSVREKLGVLLGEPRGGRQGAAGEASDAPEAAGETQGAAQAEEPDEPDSPREPAAPAR